MSSSTTVRYKAGISSEHGRSTRRGEKGDTSPAAGYYVVEPFRHFLPGRIAGFTMLCFLPALQAKHELPTIRFNECSTVSLKHFIRDVFHTLCKPAGPTNKKLRVHLPLLGPGGGLSRLRVGSDTREAVEGKALVFDDSFEHEAWNDNDNVNDNDNSHDKNEEENIGEGEGDTDDDGDDSSSSSSSINENEIGRNNRGADNNTTSDEPSCLEEAQGDDDCNDPCRPEEPGGQGGRGDCSLGEGRGKAAEKRCKRSRAAPRVTLIADVWHPDFSHR